jgi:large subunit ribosomal protein L21
LTHRPSPRYTDGLTRNGGKQYKVAVGEKLKVEQIPADIGAAFVIDEVLLVQSASGIQVGTPLVAGAAVHTTVLEQGRHDKVRIFKMRRRKHYQKRQGHRQNYTELFIATILGAGGAVVAEASAPTMAAPAAAAKPSRSKKEMGKTKDGSDDLEIVEGIGPKIAGLLRADGITTFAKLAATPAEAVREILSKAGGNFASHDPASWGTQAQMAHDGKWDALKKWQDEHIAGKV